jgi:hypothetical protein
VVGRKLSPDDASHPAPSSADVTSKPRITPVPSSVHTSDDQPAHDTTGRPPGGSLSRGLAGELAFNRCYVPEDQAVSTSELIRAAVLR